MAQIQNLLQNIADQIKEAQIKLGYVKEPIRLYYTVSSLNHLLHIDARDAAQMVALLCAQPELSSSYLGALRFAVHEDRIEASVPPQGAEYVHLNVPAPAFLSDLIRLFCQTPHCTLDDVQRVFSAHSAQYRCDQMPEGSEFDFALYFQDPCVDPYVYCLRDEMGHLIYHRFTREDYQALVP